MFNSTITYQTKLTQEIETRTAILHSFTGFPLVSDTESRNKVIEDFVHLTERSSYPSYNYDSVAIEGLVVFSTCFVTSMSFETITDSLKKIIAGLAHGAGVYDRNIVRLHLFRV